MTTNLTFGVEMEFKTGLGAEAIAQGLRDAGLDCQAEGYNHITRAHWKVVHDGSVVGGWELVSPVLSGEDGMAQVRNACDALTAMGVRIDKQCGLHVHIGARNVLTVSQIKNVVKRYIKFEPVIDTLVPPSRRGNANMYCKSLLGYAAGTDQKRDAINARLAQVDAARGVEGVSQAIFHGCRYFKLNLQSYWRHGTIEFRQHSGSVDAAKVTAWIKFCMAFVTLSIERPALHADKREMKVAARRARMLDMMFGANGVMPDPELVRFYQARAKALAA